MSLDLNLQHRRGSFGLDVTFAAADAGVTALFGPSGAGKTTVLHAVAGLLAPDSGRIVLGDRVLFDSATRIDVPARRRGLAVVFQDARLFPHLDVRANLLFGHRRQANPAPRTEIDHVIELLGLQALLSRYSHQLSGGERQRVAIGRALLASPALLLLDEPLAALDAPRRNEVMMCLERLRAERGVPMLYVTHRREEIARLADHVVMIDDGMVVRQGPVESALAEVEVQHHLIDAPTTVVRARIDSHDHAFGLTEASCAGGPLTLARVDLAVGTEIRLGVRAEDVLIATRQPEQLSANNVLEGTIVSVIDAGASWADVRLECSGQPLIARVTRRSAQRLALAPNDRVWALIKTTTLQR